MITIFLLEKEDAVLETDFCRPVVRSADFSSHSDGWVSESYYGNGPQDVMQWVRVSEVFGKCWYGKKVKELTSLPSVKYEFIRGKIPESHKYKKGRIYYE